MVVAAATLDRRVHHHHTLSCSQCIGARATDRSDSPSRPQRHLSEYVRSRGPH